MTTKKDEINLCAKCSNTIVGNDSPNEFNQLDFTELNKEFGGIVDVRERLLQIILNYSRLCINHTIARSHLISSDNKEDIYLLKLFYNTLNKTNNHQKQ